MLVFGMVTGHLMPHYRLKQYPWTPFSPAQGAKNVNPSSRTSSAMARALPREEKPNVLRLKAETHNV